MPEISERANVVLIFGKRDKSQISNYSMIRVRSLVGKLLEFIVIINSCDHIHTHNMINPFPAAGQVYILTKNNRLCIAAVDFHPYVYI